MHHRNDLFSTVLDRAVVAVLLLVLPLAAGSGPRLAAPPPPRFVPISSDVHVVAVWNGGDLGRSPLPLSPGSAPTSDTTLLSKAANASSVAPDGPLHYTIAVTNATTAMQTFHITDTLPASVSYVTGSATGGFVYDTASASLTATFTLSAFHGDVITATGAPTYTEIGSPTNPSICQQYFPECVDNAITLAGVPYRYLGVDYTAITLDSNGFVIPGAANPGLGNQNQHLPDSAVPNNVIAPFWVALDLNGSSNSDPGGGDWYYGVEHDQGSGFDYLVVEWHNAQKKGDSGTGYSFQVWIQLHAEHITFAYDHLTGDTSSATVGFENSNGTLGHSYLYNGAGSVPGPGLELQIVANFDTAQLGYDAQAQHGLRGCSLIYNTVNLSNGPGSLTASASAATAVFGPCLFLPILGR